MSETKNEKDSSKAILIAKICKEFLQKYGQQNEVDFSKTLSTVSGSLTNEAQIESILNVILKYYIEHNKPFNKDDIEIILSKDNKWFLAMDTNKEEWFYSADGNIITLSSFNTLQDKKITSKQTQITNKNIFKQTDTKETLKRNQYIEQLKQFARVNKYEINTERVLDTSSQEKYYNVGGMFLFNSLIKVYDKYYTSSTQPLDQFLENSIVLLSDKAGVEKQKKWFIVIAKDNKVYYSLDGENIVDEKAVNCLTKPTIDSLDGKNVVDEKVVNYLTKPTIEWSKINKNTKLKFGTRIAGIPKALKKHILNPQSKLNPKYYVDNECKLHDIKKESKRAEKILRNNFVKDVKKLQQEKKKKDFNKCLSYIRNNRHLDY